MSNRELPMMPWYPDQFASSAAYMTWQEKAVYRALLDAQWSTGSLENSPTVLARLCGMHLNVFKKYWQTVQVKFPLLQDGRIQNFRLEQHRLGALDRKRKIVDAGRAGGQASVKRRSSDAGSDAQASVQRSFKPPTPTPTPTVRNSVVPESLLPAKLNGSASDPRNGSQAGELAEKARALGRSGLKAGDIARMLSQYQVTVSQVEAWLA